MTDDFMWPSFHINKTTKLLYSIHDQRGVKYYSINDNHYSRKVLTFIERINDRLITLKIVMECN